MDLYIGLNLTQTCQSLSEYTVKVGFSESTDLNSPNSIDSDFSQISRKLKLCLLLSNIQYEVYSDNEQILQDMDFTSLESSDSDNEDETNSCDINSQKKILFHIKVNDLFNIFDEIRKKLDKYTIECGFAVRKEHICICKD
ncbi:21824_t:CDS:2, partial [Racocetra persica]